MFVPKILSVRRRKRFLRQIAGEARLHFFEGRLPPRARRRSAEAGKKAPHSTTASAGSMEARQRAQARAFRFWREGTFLPGAPSRMSPARPHRPRRDDSAEEARASSTSALLLRPASFFFGGGARVRVTLRSPPAADEAARTTRSGRAPPSLIVSSLAQLIVSTVATNRTRRERALARRRWSWTTCFPRGRPSTSSSPVRRRPSPRRPSLLTCCTGLITWQFRALFRRPVRDAPAASGRPALRSRLAHCLRAGACSLAGVGCSS